VWIKLTIGSGSLIFRQGSLPMQGYNPLPIFSLSDQITIRAYYPLLRTWIDGAKMVRYFSKVKLKK